MDGLFFLLSVQNFEKLGHHQFEKVAEAASLIRDSYLHPAGLLHVETITPTVKKITNDIICRCVAERSQSISMCFNAAKRQIWEVMEQVLAHFQDEQGSVFSLLNKSFGNFTADICINFRIEICNVESNSLERDSQTSLTPNFG